MADMIDIAARLRFADIRQLRTAADMQGLSQEFEAVMAEIDRLRAQLVDITIERDILRQDNSNHTAERERLRAALVDAEHALTKARIWGGMEWHDNPLHPMFYVPALEKLQAALGEQ